MLRLFSILLLALCFSGCVAKPSVVKRVAAGRVTYIRIPTYPWTANPLTQVECERFTAIISGYKSVPVGGNATVVYLSDGSTWLCLDECAEPFRIY